MLRSTRHSQLSQALREMYEHKYLHLPVRDADGTVVGIVDVMELVRGTAGEGGGKGWRDFFSGAMDARGDVGRGAVPFIRLLRGLSEPGQRAEGSG